MRVKCVLASAKIGKEPVVDLMCALWEHLILA